METHCSGLLAQRPTLLPSPPLQLHALQRCSLRSSIVQQHPPVHSPGGPAWLRPEVSAHGTPLWRWPLRTGPPHMPCQRPQPRLVASAAASAADGVPEGRHRRRRGQRISNMLEAAIFQYTKFSSLAPRFMPMVTLFFLLAFTNTILDSLKDTLVITAVGGGAHVIPYLTVYAVLPSSLIFLYLYSIASQRLSRAQMFNGIVTIFMGFFVLFAYVLYPNHHVLHPHQLADSLTQMLPSGMSGLVGMFRNWTFTLMFCMSELWGDVCLGLLFWGLANETTSLSDAHTLYPLFGLGANVAQAAAGLVLKAFSSRGTFISQIQTLMLLCIVLSVGAAVMYSTISRQDNEQKALDAKRKRQRNQARRRQQEQQLEQLEEMEQLEQLEQQERYSNSHQDENGVASGYSGSCSTSASSSPLLSSSYLSATTPSAAVGAGGQAGAAAHSSRQAAEQRSAGGRPGAAQQPVASPTSPPEQDASHASSSGKEKPSVQEIFSTLARSVPIQCLAMMSLAQGLCSNLMEYAWKSHIKLLYPTPAQFTSFLGDVSTWQGIFTGGLMILSPAMFARMGWKEVAAATPQVLLVGGAVFFAACIAFQTWSGGAHAALAAGTSTTMLKALVYGGALLYVFSKSAKFSMHKPSEEMVYISLDEEGRTKGKAAIDVVGSQAGKSGGSMLQQLLLLVSGGSLAGSLPIMSGVYLLMANGWLRSVSRLSDFNPRYGHPDSVHPTLGTVDETDDDEEEERRREAEVLQMLSEKRAHAAGNHLQPGSSVDGAGSAIDTGASGASAGIVNASSSGGTSSGNSHDIAVA